MDKEKLKLLLKTWEDKGIKADKVGEWYVRIYGEIDNKPMVELESFQIVVREREKLKKEKQELEYLGDINEELKEENKKLNKQIEQFKKGVKAGTNIIERLEEENKELKEKLEQIKEAYIRFEDSWGEYNKGLGELDQVIMNR